MPAFLSVATGGDRDSCPTYVFLGSALPLLLDTGGWGEWGERHFSPAYTAIWKMKGRAGSPKFMFSGSAHLCRCQRDQLCFAAQVKCGAWLTFLNIAVGREPASLPAGGPHHLTSHEGGSSMILSCSQGWVAQARLQGQLYSAAWVRHMACSPECCSC